MTDETGSGKLVFDTAPTLSSTVTVGTAGGTTGAMLLNGTTSGTVTLSVADAAGTWTMKLPTSAGTNGYVLTTDGAGNTSWTNNLASDISCRIRQSSGQSITLNTLTALNFDTEDFDTDTMHDNVTNNTRITFATTGKYLVTGAVTTDGNAGAY